MLLRCSTGLDHIELSISFLGIFLHSLKCPLKAFKMSLASIQAKTPHFLGYPSIPAHPIALVYEVPWHPLSAPQNPQLTFCPLGPMMQISPGRPWGQVVREGGV